MLLLISIHFFHCLRCTSACTKIVNVKNKNGSGDIFHSKTKKERHWNLVEMDITSMKKYSSSN